MPIWDDDFTSWFWKIKDKHILQTILEIVSPISTQPQFWGFNERPMQALIYQIFHHVSGYESWSFFVYKDLIYAGIGVMIYNWGLRLVPKDVYGRSAALAGALFLLIAPGPIEAHILHSDFATTAEFLFLSLTYVIWSEVEKTPYDWQSFPLGRTRDERRWMLRWFGISFLTYIAYKSKADLKLIPAILGSYVLITRPRQWKLFSWPIAFMLLLAVPWGGAIFHKLPPFMPGSRGSEIGWMWQPASVSRLLDFVWSSQPWSLSTFFNAPTLSLSALLGPFLLLGLASFLVWKNFSERQITWSFRESAQDRARTFVLLWLFFIFVAVSALPELNYSFRVRYGILTMIPTTLLLIWALGYFASSIKQAPRWVTAMVIALFAVQASVNFNRSITQRLTLGHVMVAVDQVYERFSRDFSNYRLALLPEFLPYDYRPDAPASIHNKERLASMDDLRKGHTPYRTYVISWQPTLWEQLELVGHFSGCRDGSLFDHIFPCAPSSGSYLMRYIGEEQLFVQGEELKKKGDFAGALAAHEEFLARHPLSLAGLFAVGFEKLQLQDWSGAEQAYATLERYFPDHPSVLNNHGYALERLSRYPEAAKRFKIIFEHQPMNYMAGLRLYQNYKSAGEAAQANALLASLRTKFSGNPEFAKMQNGI
jgi:tetratricopeptide (TPR) repeat protein